jgi:integrase/recombinase XerD
MGEVDWFRYPLVRDSDCGRRWLQIQNDLGLAKNTVEAYGRGLDEYLRFVRDLEMDPTECNREIIACFIRSLRVKPGATRGKVISIRAKAVLSNSTLQQRLTAVRVFYDFLVEEQLCEKNPVGRGRYTPGKAFGSMSQRGLVQRYDTLPWIPTEDEWRSILAVVQTKPTRVRLMFALGYDAALRREELLLEGKNNLLRMRQEIPLGESEIAALDDGVSALESLLSRLAYIPTPAGPTPLQLRSDPLVQIQLEASND